MRDGGGGTDWWWPGPPQVLNEFIIIISDIIAVINVLDAKEIAYDRHSFFHLKHPPIYTLAYD